MDFSLTEEQTAIQASFRAFAEREIRPIAADLDKNPRFPTEIFEALARLGFTACVIPNRMVWVST